MQHAQFASIWFVYWQHSAQYSLARLMLRVATRRYASHSTPHSPCPLACRSQFPYPFAFEFAFAFPFRLALAIALDRKNANSMEEEQQRKKKQQKEEQQLRNGAKRSKPKPNRIQPRRGERRIELKR